MSDMYGIPLDVAQQRLAQQAHFGDVAETLIEQYPDALGGAWVDFAHDGMLHLRLTHEPAELASYLSSELTDNDVAVSQDATYSYQALTDSVSAVLTLARESMLTQPIAAVTAGIDDANNRVAVTINQAALSPILSTALNRLLSVTPGEFEVSYTNYPADDSTELSCSNALVSCDQPLRGGVRIFDDGHPNGLCTAGFVTYDDSGARYYLTAGHCLQDSTSNHWNALNSNGNNIGLGNQIRLHVDSLNDEGIIDISNENHEPDIFLQASSTQAHTTGHVENYDILGSAHAVQGDWVCKTGYIGNTDCGFVTDASTTSTSFVGDSVAVDMRFSGGSGDACHGDSGGAVVAAGYAYGMVQSGDRPDMNRANCFTSYFYTKIGRGTNGLNVNLSVAS
jgi:Trypsin